MMEEAAPGKNFLVDCSLQEGSTAERLLKKFGGGKRKTARKMQASQKMEVIPLKKQPVQSREN